MKIHLQRPRPDDGRTLDMTPDGEFVSPPHGFRPGPQSPFSSRLLRAAVLVAALGGVVIVAGLALWLALLMIPVVLVAAGIAYGAYRWRLWQAGRSR
jgi:hypothetical protein